MDTYLALVKEEPVTKSLIVLVSIMIGYIVGKLASRALHKVVVRTLDIHQSMIAKRLAFYIVLILCTLTGLNEAGINLSVLVGAAGVASVAIGFASQTTMSNLISGIFMLIERPFMVGDVIKLGGTTGEVSTMGLFSTILKTPDNTMVRIPNETLMKSEISNLTRFQTRRVEILIGISYSADIKAARELIAKTIAALPMVRKEPAPNVVFKSFGDSAINLSLDFWVDTAQMGAASNEAAQAVKTALEGAQIEMPFPQRTISFAQDYGFLGR